MKTPRPLRGASMAGEGEPNGELALRTLAIPADDLAVKGACPWAM